MTTRKDPTKLPIAARDRFPVKPKPLSNAAKQRPSAAISATNVHVELDKAHLTQAIDGGLEIARGIVEIARIRETSDAAVREIHARTRQITALLEKQIDAMRLQHDALVDRGKIVCDILAGVSQMMEGLPSGEAAYRQKALELIPQLVEQALANQGPSPEPLN